MKYLLFGICSSMLLFLSSCEKNKVVDGNDTINYIYVNELETDVKVEYEWAEYGDDGKGEKEHSQTETITSGNSLNQKIQLNDPNPILILECNSVKFVFKDDRELIFQKNVDSEASVFDIKNYTYIRNSENEESYTYRITKDIYALSTPKE